MKAERLNNSRVIKLTELPEKLFDVTMPKHLTISVHYNGETSALRAVMLDNFVIPAIVEAVNSQRDSLRNPRPVFSEG